MNRSDNIINDGSSILVVTILFSPHLPKNDPKIRKNSRSDQKYSIDDNIIEITKEGGEEGQHNAGGDELDAYGFYNVGKLNTLRSCLIANFSTHGYSFMDHFLYKY